MLLRRSLSVLLSALALPLGAATLLPATATAQGCDVGAISAGLGQSVSVLRCYGNWAYVSNGEFGDSTALAQLTGRGWVRYSGFPSSICKAQAAAAGVPAAELSSFRPC